MPNAALELADHRDLKPHGLEPIGRLGGELVDLGHAQQLDRLGQPCPAPELAPDRRCWR
jgi:hypothetical protein